MNKNKTDSENKIKRLSSPAAVCAEFPLSEERRADIIGRRREIAEIVSGRSAKLLVVVGPCSIHNEQAALEYAELLKKAQRRYQKSLFLVMRTYFEKPRTGLGWKGLISDPYLNETYDIDAGLRLARKILFKVNELGVPAATEFLEIMTVQYLYDLVSWGAIGARTVESQLHRELASFLPLPVGFKNSTTGEVASAVEAVMVAQGTHNFLSADQDGRAAIFTTSGNESGHVVLRGGKDSTNYDKGSIAKAAVLLKRNNLVPRVLVDCSHGNSQKQYAKQGRVLADVARQIANGSRAIAGVMLESHLLAGSQPFNVQPEPVYNRSITDTCISWEETEILLDKLAKAADDSCKSRLK